MSKTALDAVFAQATGRLKSLGFSLVPFDPVVHIDKRATVRLGSCRRRKDGMYQVGISPWVIETEDATLIADVLAHEACHLVKDAMNHGPLWKAAAQAMHDAFGYTITRTYAGKESSPREFPYAVQCTHCGIVMERVKRSKVIRQPQRYRCSKCHGTLKRIR